MARADASPIRPPAGVTEGALDRLYRAPLEQFTSDRNELAKDLRAEGEGAAADWVKKLRKPTRAAWIVNQLSERKGPELARLLEAGRELRSLQEGLLSGEVDRDELRRAAAREREEVEGLLKAAVALGREHEVGGAVIDRVGETLQAAAADPELAETIELGRLEREQRASTVGAIGAAPSAAERPGKRAKSGKRDQAAAIKRRRAERERAGRCVAAERKLAAAEKRVKRERAAVERARGALDDRERKLLAAEQEARDLKGELDSI